MPRKTNEYTAVAGAEKRLREILDFDGFGLEIQDPIVRALTHGAEIEYKPRLKALVITIPIPQPAPEPRLGEFTPKSEPEDGYYPGEGDEDVIVG